MAHRWSVPSLLPLIAAVGCALSPSAPPVAEPATALQGHVHGGQQPVSGAHIYLLAASTSGYGSASLSLLGKTGHSDTIGSYVLSGTDGSFTVSNDYTCTPDTQVYLYALGGNPGNGVNANAGFLAALGNCPTAGNFQTTTPNIWVNEVSTVAAAYAFAGFATDPLHVASSGTALAQTGIRNAFANAANLASISTGTALALTPAGNGVVPQAEINTLANILASCVNTTGIGSTSCNTLFANALSAGTTGTSPTDTAAAAINIAHNPGANVVNLFGLQSGVASPFLPDLSAIQVYPNPHYDFTIALQFTGGGISAPLTLAADAQGNVWIGNRYCGTQSLYSCVSVLGPTGAPITSSTGYNKQTNDYFRSIAIDLQGNAWTTNPYNHITEYSPAGVISTSAYTGTLIDDVWGLAFDTSSNVWIANGTPSNDVIEFNSAKAPITTTAGYTGGGLYYPIGIAIDPSGYVWVGNGNSSITKLSSTGLALSPATGYTGGGLSGGEAVAIDHTGNIWVTSNGVTAEFTNAGSAISSSSGFGAFGGSTGPTGMAIDGLGNAWVAGYKLGEISSSGTILSPSYGFFTQTGSTYTDYTSLAIDGSGNVWTNIFQYFGQTGLQNYSNVTEFIGVAAPVVTPIASGVKNNTLGTRP